MESFETIEASRAVPDPERYKKIDEKNRTSFLMVEGSPLRVVQSLYSVGVSREVLSEEIAKTNDDEKAEELKDKRQLINGNMSPLNKYGPSELTPEQRIEDAKNNVHEFLDKQNIDIADVRLLLPERDYDTPLTVINLDETPLVQDDTDLLRPDKRADMLYTYDPTIIMAARPADCPIAYVTAETPKGEVTVLIHLATLGVAHGYVPQAKQILDNLDVEWSSVRVQLTPGGHAETYKYENFPDYNPAEKFPETSTLYVNIEETKTDKGERAWNFDVDVAAEAYKQIVEKWNIDEYQVYLDTTDTTSPESGYSSNSRAFKGYEVDGDNTRDLVLAARRRLAN